MGTRNIGTFVSDHPLRRAKSVFRKKGVLIADVPHKANRPDKKEKHHGRRIAYGASKNCDKTGKQMAILQIEDPSGKIEAVVFPKSYEALSENWWSVMTWFWVKGKAENRDGQWQMVVDTIEHQLLSEIEALAKQYAEENLIPRKNFLLNFLL